MLTRLLGLFLGYAFVGFVCYLVMVGLGEMASFLPHKKGFAGYATRFVDPALGFAMGWNYLMKYVCSFLPPNAELISSVARSLSSHLIISMLLESLYSTGPGMFILLFGWVSRVNHIPAAL